MRRMTSAPRPAPEASDQREREGQREGLGTIALTLGLIAAGTCLTGASWSGMSWLGWPGFVLGLAAVVVGFVGSRRAFHDPHRNGAASLGGLALGLVGLVVGAWLVVPGLLGIGTFGEGLSLDECMAQAQGQHEERMCASQHLDEYRARYGDPGGTGG
jgi:protein-S-isoprenylcysteine O-methyltransferase Ste14